MTTSDVDKMQYEFHDRRRTGRQAPGRRLILAAAAVLLLVVAAAAGTLWLRRPEPLVPANPQGLDRLPAITLDADATTSNLTAVRPDHTLTGFPTARDLVHRHPAPWTIRWRVEGNMVITDAVDAQGISCPGLGAMAGGVRRPRDP